MSVTTQFEQVILRCILDMTVVDSFIDSLLAYPQHELKITSYQVQSHHQSLEDIREKVSGFKEQMVFEITLPVAEVNQLKIFLQNDMKQVNYETQIIPLLSSE